MTDVAPSEPPVEMSLGAELNKIKMTPEQIHSLLHMWGLPFRGRPDEPTGEILEKHGTELVQGATTKPADAEPSSFTVSDPSTSV